MISKTLGIGLTALSMSLFPILSESSPSRAAPQYENWPRVIGGKSYAVHRERFTVAGQVFEDCLFIPERDHPGFAIYDIDGKYVRLDALIGLDDSGVDFGATPYSFEVDGKQMKSGTVKKGQKAVPITLDLTGARTLRIDLGTKRLAGIVDSPLLLQARLTKAGSPAALVSQNVGPLDKAKISPGRVQFVWKEVPGATCYAIEIVATKFDAPVSPSAPRLWSFSSAGSTVHQIDLGGFEQGEYAWRVAPFDGTKQLGAWSVTTTFVIRK